MRQVTPDEVSIEDIATPLDLLLAAAALGPRGRFLPWPPVYRFTLGLLRQPGMVASSVVGFALEAARIVAQHPTRGVDELDSRFADPAWMSQPALRTTMELYLSGTRSVRGLRSGVDLDWRDAAVVDFALENLLALLSPSNNPLLNPLAYRAAFDSGGRSVLRGLRNLLSDLSQPPRLPSMVAQDAFVVGQSLAATEGAVVARDGPFELIQYLPRTTKTYQVPVLLVPPTINKYYVLDLAPGRSLVDYLVRAGHQVFMMSWRNPDRRHSSWDLSTYVQAVMDAMAATRVVTSATSTALFGLCSGGIIASITAALLAEQGRASQLASLALGVSMLDQEQAGLPGAVLDRRTAAAAVRASATVGYLEGRALAEMFAWLRPNDLIWAYWVNNYLQGKRPKPFDVLYWNADTTRMAAGLHRDFINLAMTNSLTGPGQTTVLGTAVDLGRVEVDSYVMAGSADHICPWKICFASTQLLGGTSRFVLSNSGHVGSIVNPPGNPKARYRTTTRVPSDPGTWLDTATDNGGSWWTDYQGWLALRSGNLRRAPETLGASTYPILGPAPGSYIFAT